MNTTLEAPNFAGRRPRPVTIASMLLLLNVFVLLAWWIAVPQQVESNGAQLFFMIVWFSVSIAIFRGMSWVRYAILVTLAVFLCEILNSQQPMSMVVQMGLGDQLSKSLALVAAILLFLPRSHQWFMEIKNFTRSQEKPLFQKPKKQSRAQR
ncbi:MAG: hypothetical protein OXG08_07090 [Gammaproteobacteria bacterium]|nr:hypothetical protein [Gammaproteobacteria bacterium]